MMDETFQPENFVGIVNIAKTSGLAAGDSLAVTCDYLLWYAKERGAIKYRQLFVAREPYGDEAAIYGHIELPDGSRRPMTKEEKEGRTPLSSSAKRYRLGDLTKPGPGSRFTFDFQGKTYDPGRRWW